MSLVTVAAFEFFARKQLRIGLVHRPHGLRGVIFTLPIHQAVGRSGPTKKAAAPAAALGGSDGWSSIAAV